MSEELEQYEYQLAQVEQALKGDKDNEELINLKDGLVSLIDILKSSATEQSKASTPAAKTTRTNSGTTSSTATAPKKTYTTGEECLARYSKDRKFYSAKIISVGGPGSTAENPMYTVRFSDYVTTELVSANDIRPPAEQTNKKRAAEAEEIEKERARRRARTAKKEEKRQVKETEQMDKRKAWSSFAKKGSKKGLKGLGQESMFKTPDNPYGKVGVVGSGKGMTMQQGSGRHKFDDNDDQGQG